eukprot:6970404-Alexandrium_andersonii.AAC.1
MSKYASDMIAGTINLSGVTKPLMHHSLEQFMYSSGAQLLALSETKHPGTTKYVVGDVLYSASPQAGPGAKEHA